MNHIRMNITAALTIALVTFGCGGTSATDQTSSASQTPGAGAPAAQAGTKSVTFTAADLDQFERGLRSEIEAVKAAQKKAASATTPQERGQAMQAQWETATIPVGATASGLAEPRYKEIREAVDGVLMILDFQSKIDGPLEIDLARADAAMKARVAGDAFAGLPSPAATALRARMDRLVPVWIEYKKLVAVAG